MPRLQFHIYLSGTTGFSKQFVQLFEQACAHYLPPGSYAVQLIDILKQPHLAEEHKVLAIPTISRITPGPEKRIIGRLNEEQARYAVQFLTEDLSI